MSRSYGDNLTGSQWTALIMACRENQAALAEASSIHDAADRIAEAMGLKSVSIQALAEAMHAARLGASWLPARQPLTFGKR